MKYLRKLAGALVFLTLIIMIIAAFQFKNSEEEGVWLPEQLEYNYSTDWVTFSLDGAKVPDGVLWNQDKIQGMIKDVLEEENYWHVDLPYEGKSRPGDIIVFKNTLPKEYAGLRMKFFSIDSAVCVVLDGKVIYQYMPEQNEPKSVKLENLEKNENIVNIPNEVQDGELWVELTSDHLNAAAMFDMVKIEAHDAMVIGIVGGNIADIGCCLLILIMAVIMFVLALIRRYTRQPSRGELLLGLAGLAAGINYFIGTDTLSIFYDVQRAYAMREYLVMLLPLLLTLYYERALHRIYPRRFFVLLCCVSVNAAGQILLRLLGIWDLENIINVSSVMSGAICVAVIVSLIQLDYKSRSYEALLSALSMLVLMIGEIVSILLNIFSEYAHGSVAGQYSMAGFSVMMAVMHVLQLSKEYRADAEKNAQLLQEKVKAAQQQNRQLILAKKDADMARHEAMAANEAKGKFLANMSHEIRTPINAVLGMDEMILRESREQNIKEYAMDIYMAGQTLLSLINDILDFSKIDSGKMEIVPVEYDFSSMVHDLVNMASQRAQNKNISLEAEVDCEIPSRLYGDDVRIRQVLTNILTNAVKYTHEGTVWLRVRGRVTGDTAVLAFEVEDTGIGIKEEDLPKLSAEFERIEEDKNRNIEGTGLGMNITIQLLELMGSRLHVESVYGKGSKFSFELEQKIVSDTPIGDFQSRVRQLAEDYSYSTKFYAPDANILVVDDNAVNRKVLRNLLKETQVQVTDADGGKKCLELVQENHYDLIFLDHMMPEMDGVETLHRMKELSDYPCRDTPVVVLTANAVSGAKEAYLSEGFDDFLSKPVAPQKLEHMIQKMLPDELLREAAGEPKAEPLEQAGNSTPEDALEELPQVDGLDWQYAWLHLPDMELLEYTVKEFYAQIDSAADHLEQAYGQTAEQIQLEAYRIQVHAMKSLAATVGIMPLSGVAKILEYAARDGRVDVVRSITPAFLDEWRSYRQKLQGVFGIGMQERKEVNDYSLIQALVEMVRLSMQELDVDQADQAMSQLQAYEYPQEMGQNIQKLAEAVTNLDPDGADRLADLLISQMER